jgi:hypothetical protein
MLWAGNVAHMRMRNAQKNVFGNPETKITYRNGGHKFSILLKCI